MITGGGDERRMEGVLCELNHNSGAPVSMCAEGKKPGSWKRRARAIQTPTGKENGMALDAQAKEVSGKRGFELRDEDEVPGDEEYHSKKLKSGGENLQLSENMVEIASPKWPQGDQ